MIRVLVHGAAGKMGQMVMSAVCRESDLQLVGAVDVRASGDSISAEGCQPVAYFQDLTRALDAVSPQVVVDFSTARAVLPMARIVLTRGIHLVSGTTGLSAEELQEIDSLARDSGTGAVVAANFAVGAVVMMRLAAQAARYFDHVEIIEEHHDQKLDAPSGTALTSARLMSQARKKPFTNSSAAQTTHPSRGLEEKGTSIHSVRLPGIVARQEVLFGAAGQTLSIKHDAISRECFMPGVILAVRQVARHKGLVSGLDTLLDFQEE